MTDKKDLIIAVLATFCVTSALFSIMPTRSQTTKEYDPMADLTGPEGVPDGVINMRDIGYMCDLFGTTGTPVNWTQLLEDMDYLKDKVAELETEIDILNSTQGLGPPDFDSGWTALSIGDNYMVHDLQTTDLLVYMIGKSSSGIHQYAFGCDTNNVASRGACWWELDQTQLRITRLPEDTDWVQVRVLIWKIP